MTTRLGLAGAVGNRRNPPALRLAAPAMRRMPTRSRSRSGLRTWFFTADGIVKAVDGVDIHVDPGEVVGLVGESGSGKSVTSFSILRLVSPPGRMIDGSIRFRGEELMRKSEAEMRDIRGDQISMIFQQPLSSLNPAYRVGFQIGEVYEIHRDVERKVGETKAVEMLRKVGIPDPGRRARSYPHQLSGGQAQRVMIAMALAGDPDLLVADEPTTALDVTIQAQILELMRELQADLGMSDRAHHPRPRHRGRDGRPRGGHVRRPDRRADRHQNAVPRPEASLHPGADRLGPRDRRSDASGSRSSPAGCRTSSASPTSAGSPLGARPAWSSVSPIAPRPCPPWSRWSPATSVRCFIHSDAEEPEYEAPVAVMKRKMKSHA